MIWSHTGKPVRIQGPRLISLSQMNGWTGAKQTMQSVVNLARILALGILPGCWK